MAISNTNGVCIGCRKSSRHGWTCSRCHKPMISMGKRWRVPKKTDDKEWKIIELKFGRKQV